MKYLYFIITLVLFFATIYFTINVEILLWYLVDPMGFWGYCWFLALSSAIFFSLLFLVQMVFGVILTINSGNLNKGVIFLILFIGAIDFAIPLGAQLFITRLFYNKTRYIDQTEKYLSRGHYEKALNLSSTLFNRTLKNGKDFNRIWFLKKYYLNSKKGRLAYINREYLATINYAQCLMILQKEMHKAEQLFFKCEKLYKQNFSMDINYYLTPLMGRITLYIYTGETIKAEQGYNEVSRYFLDIGESNLTSALDLMILFSAVKERYGDFERAAEIRTDALELYKKSNRSMESSRYLSLLLGVAKDKLRNRLMEETNKILIECSKIANKKKSDLDYLQYLNLLAQFKELEGSIAAAKDLYSEVTKLSKKKHYIVYSENLTQEASFYFRQKDYQKSFSKYLQSWQVYQKEGIGRFPIKHVDLTNFSLSCYSIGKMDSAKMVMFAVDSMVKDAINKSFLMLTQNEKESFVYKTGKTYQKSSSLYLALNDTSLNGIIYNNNLSVKSIALMSNQYLNKILYQTGNEEFKVEYNNIIFEKAKHEGLTLSHTLDEKMISTSIDSISLVERDFMDKIRNLGLLDGFRVDDVKWKDIQRSLKEDEVAIEIVNFPLDPCLEENRKYYALLINSSVSNPIIIPLFEESSVTKLFDKNSGMKSSINSLYSGESITSLYEYIWTPLKPHLGGIKKVYLSISGVLHLISFPALTQNESQDVVVLSSTRLLVDRTIEFKQKNKKALLYGDISYMTNEETDTVVINEDKTSISGSLNRAINRININKLPETRIEIENISKILAKSKIETEIFTKEIATEKSFRKSSSDKPGIIHISTHGFYYPVEYSPIIKENLFGIENDYTSINNPMNRSGLLFAGITPGKLKTHLNDGILTSNEISHLNLLGVDLVVLSACETGLGEIQGDEGVFGLQRAFKLAGVKSLILSLWKVTDKETSELMSQFYKYYLSGSTANEALKKAQSDIRKRYPDPFYWAAFFVVD